MPLTSTQLSEIKDFIHSRGFTHIEVEMEILDHVASAVESKLEANPNKSLTKAIQEVHAGFGVMGFSTIEDEKSKFFHKLIKNELWKALKSYIMGEKIWISILFMIFITAVYLIFRSDKVIIRLFPFILGIGTIVYTYSTGYRKFKKWRSKSLMLSLAGTPLLIIQPNFGNFIGMIAKDLTSFNPQFSIVLYVGLNLIMVIFTLAGKDTLEWGFNWTNERYLKYA